MNTAEYLQAAGELAIGCYLVLMLARQVLYAFDVVQADHYAEVVTEVVKSFADDFLHAGPDTADDDVRQELLHAREAHA